MNLIFNYPLYFSFCHFFNNPELALQHPFYKGDVWRLFKNINIQAFIDTLWFNHNFWMIHFTKNRITCVEVGGYYKGQKCKNENFKEMGWLIILFDPYNSEEHIVYLQNKTGALNYYFFDFAHLSLSPIVG